MARGPGPHFETVVVGSGYGGAAVAISQSQKGRQVLILERGTWWWPNAASLTFPFPRFLAERTALQPTQAFPETLDEIREASEVFSSNECATPSGAALYHLHDFASALVLAANGVGGNSLIDGGCSTEPIVVPTSHDFTVSEGDYRRARDWLLAHRRARDLHLASATSEDSTESTAPPDLLGTDGYAALRSSLSHTFLEHLPLEDDAPRVVVRPLANVDAVEPLDIGYAVYFTGLTHASQQRITCDTLILAAGAIGSTEILLRSRERYGARFPMSKSLGERVSANGNLFAVLAKDAPFGSFGASGNHSGGGKVCRHVVRGERTTVELALRPFPEAFKSALQRLLASHVPLTIQAIADSMQTAARNKEQANSSLQPSPTHLMGLTCNGVDESYGRFALREDCLQLVFRPRTSEDPAIQLGRVAMTSLASSLDAELHMIGGEEKFLATNLTGGCPVGGDSTTGTVNQHGQLYDSELGRTSVYPGLFVADSSIVPFSVGVDSALTVVSLALRVADSIP